MKNTTPALILISYLFVVNPLAGQNSSTQTEDCNALLAEYKTIAEMKTREADHTKKELERVKKIFLAKELSRISKQVDDDKLRRLLVLQAQQLNVQADGYIYDADILSALITEASSTSVFSVSSFQEQVPPSLLAGTSRTIWLVNKQRTISKLQFDGGKWNSAELMKLPFNMQNSSIHCSEDGTTLGIISDGKLWMGKESSKGLQLMTSERPIDQIVFLTADKIVTINRAGGQLTFFQDGKKTGQDLAPKEIMFVDKGKADEIIYLTTDQKLYRLNVVSGTAVESTILPAKYRLTSFASYPTNNLLIFGYENGSVTITNTDSGRTITLIKGEGAVSDIDVSARFLLVVYDNKTARIWNRDNLRERPVALTLDNANSFQLIGDELFLRTSSNGEHNLQVIPIDAKRLAEALCGTVNRNLTEEEHAIYIGDFPYVSTCK